MTYKLITSSELTNPELYQRDTQFLWNVQASPSHAEVLIEFGARVCYRSVADMGHAKQLITQCMNNGHHDVIEHGHAVVSTTIRPSFWNQSKFLEFEQQGDTYYIGGNLRAWYELLLQISVYEAYEMYWLLATVAPSIFPTKDSVKNLGYSDNTLVKVCGSLAQVGNHTQLIGIDRHIFQDSQLALKFNQATIYFDGVSRTLSHQLVRHRLASFSQVSQRYVDRKKGDWGWITPPSFKKNPEVLHRFEEYENYVNEFYDWLREQDIKKEDARFVLPNACGTSILMSGSFAMWDHFLTLREAKDTQWEIRDCAHEIRAQLNQVAPHVF